MCSAQQLLLLSRLISISKSVSKAALRLGPRFDVVNSYKSAINISLSVRHRGYISHQLYDPLNGKPKINRAVMVRRKQSGSAADGCTHLCYFSLFRLYTMTDNRLPKDPGDSDSFLRSVARASHSAPAHTEEYVAINLRHVCRRLTLRSLTRELLPACRRYIPRVSQPHQTVENIQRE